MTLQQIIDFLNEAVALDREAITALYKHRVACNEDLADHPSIIIWSAEETGSSPMVSMLGLLNGALATEYPRRIAAKINDSGIVEGFCVVVMPNGLPVEESEIKVIG